MANNDNPKAGQALPSGNVIVKWQQANPLAIAAYFLIENQRILLMAMCRNDYKQRGTSLLNNLCKFPINMLAN